MRKNPVSTERLFWSMVCNRKLDGPFHRKAYDEARDEFLRAKGFRVVRLTNDDFASDAGTALMIVKHALEIGTPSP